MNQPQAPIAFRGLHVHLIGVGGAGMNGAARMLLRFGARVSGSDRTPFDCMGRLVEEGARVTIGHDAAHLDPDTQLVVISAAIPERNPELAEARRRGIPVLKYAELLGAIMAHRRGVAVAGTHGKSTTTAMCAYLFREAGLDPSFVVGAQSPQLGGGSGVGGGPHFIVESCEFDRSFWHLHPHSATILNIEPDHLDCYKDLDEIVGAFTQFARQVSPDGLLVVNGKDVLAQHAARSAPCRVETVTIADAAGGAPVAADWCATNLRRDRGRYGFEVLRHGRRVLSTQLFIPGLHNVENALAAVALAHHAGADTQAVARALAAFAGVGRRLTWRGEGRGVTIVDDYAHHPTEVRVTIEAARFRYEPKRMWVVFQPHQHARTRVFMDEFAQSFGGADEIIVPDVYGARESDEPENGCGSEELVSRICQRGGKARYLSALASAAEHVVEHAVEGDLVLTMGAGDVWKVADELVERICGGHPARCTPRQADVVPSGRPRAVPVPTP
ncbi:MAG: UDP-N-acetylmuramate--L-alanine ligase [Planctomycetes bacterium]|nr:UDP-N-acetylmuramate--L-alanine ligase [Planctomycetota bacterium]